MARLKLTLTMESGARIGPGKAALLESVRSSGSISAAARAMGMDYKRAWLLVDSLNRAFDTPVGERATGGSGGGGAVLTPFGKDLLARYRKLEARAAKLAAADLKAIEKHAVPLILALRLRHAAGALKRIGLPLWHICHSGMPMAIVMAGLL